MVKKKKSSPKNKSNNVVFLASLTGLWLIIVLVTKLVIDTPQCPENYTQAQVDAANCIIGANIGLGTIMLFVAVPITILLVVLWGVALFGKKK
ncbi:MAG: hypothetical protein M3P98_03175 [bacterium]|nr:hypothetical protein [bacterium]